MEKEKEKTCARRVKVKCEVCGMRQVKVRRGRKKIKIKGWQVRIDFP